MKIKKRSRWKCTRKFRKYKIEPPSELRSREGLTFQCSIHKLHEKFTMNDDNSKQGNKQEGNNSFRDEATFRSFIKHIGIAFVTCTDGKDSTIIPVYDYMQSKDVMPHKTVDEVIKILEEYKKTFSDKAIQNSRQKSARTAHNESLYEPDVNFEYLFSQRKTKLGYIYFIRKASTQIYKIGFSKKPELRRSALQVAQDVLLTLELKIETTSMKRLEDYLHDLLRNRKLEGEWFDLTGITLDEMKAIAEEWEVSNNG